MSDTNKPNGPTQPSSANLATPSITFSPQSISHQSSTSSKVSKGKQSEQSATSPPSRSISRNSSRPTKSPNKNNEHDTTAWGSNFWVTLVDPQTQTSFYACPATGQVSWDPPIGNFVLPPNENGEWWELTDDARGGIPYYYQTKTGETVWERPEGFVIPLGVVQNTALGRRLSQNYQNRSFQSGTNGITHQQHDSPADKPTNGRSPRSTTPERLQVRTAQAGRPSTGGPGKRLHGGHQSNGGLRAMSPQLSPIPGSPYVTEHSAPPSPVLNRSNLSGSPMSVKSDGESPNNKAPSEDDADLTATLSKARGRSYPSLRSPQSLKGAAERLASTEGDEQVFKLERSPTIERSLSFGDSILNSSRVVPSIDIRSDSSASTSDRDTPITPTKVIPSKYMSKIAAKGISAPIINHAATMEMSPVRHRALGQPIPVEPPRPTISGPSMVSLSTGTYPILPQDLAMDIQQFSESEYAKQYFSTHRSGFIFKRRVPVAQLLTWQKQPLASPLLTLNKSLHRDAVRIFKVIQRIMGDRERERPVGVRLQPDSRVAMASPLNASTTSLNYNLNGILEEERWLIGEGLLNGELRDEIYCQLMKQLTGNPNAESVFKGWQFLCVLLISFPPSKNFETYLHSFIQKHTKHQEGRIDVIAKYCLRRLSAITRKGPRGKPPSFAEIETASDAAFNPSIFGESLDAIIRLQERNYPQKKVPIILPFLADGILALGGLRAEGIFRIPGDNDSVSELKHRIDRGYYTLDNVDDPHVLASLLKLWLRELCEPLIPNEMYNECIMNSNEPSYCVRIVERLPTINRRVLLFVINFLQLFLEDKIQNITKMTPANLALVMAPNLLRCNSVSVSVVFTNAQYEQLFVYNLLLHLRCDEVDAQYKPTHGLGAISESPPSQFREWRR